MEQQQSTAMSTFCFLLLVGDIFPAIHCAFVSDRDFVPCPPRIVTCSCPKETGKQGTVQVPVKYCGRNAKQCLPCEDFKSQCLKRCHEKGEDLVKIRKRRETCNAITPSERGRPIVRITSGLSRTMLVDDTLQLTCEVKSNPAAEVFWLFKGKPVKPTSANQKYQLFKCNRTLLITALEITDTGNYTCAGVNKLGNSSATSVVTVKALNDAPQIFSFEIEDKDHAYAGGSVNLTCLAAAKSGIIQFRKHGEELIEDGQRLFYRQLHDLPNRNYVKAALEIRNVSFGDAVNYTCVAVDARRNIVRKRFRLVVVPCPEGHYCPANANEEHTCPPSTYNDGSQNVTYNCTQCPDGIPDNSTKYRYGLTAVTDCPTRVPGPRSGDPLPPSNDKIWQYFLIPAGVLLVIVLAMVIGWRWSLKKRRSSIGSSHQFDLPYKIDVIDGSLLEHAPDIDVEVKYDAFICYSSKNSPFAQQLLGELERRGFRCCVDVRDFEVGAAIVENIADAIYGSRKTLAILSPDFVKSKWCRHEIRQALARIRAHLVVPILLAECDIPPLLRDRTYLDWINCQDKDFFWSKLEETLGRGKI